MRPIAVIFALRAEAAPFLRMMTKRRTVGDGVTEGRIGDTRLLVAVSGMGYRRAEIAAGAVLDAHGVERIIAAGFAGALRPELQSGGLLIADQVLDSLADPTFSYPCTARLSGIPMRGIGVCIGSLATVGRVISCPQEKACLRRRYDCDAVDMESAAVASVAHFHEIPFGAVRAIVDRADESIPPVLTGIMREDGSIRLLAALSAMARHPQILPNALRISRQSAIAARNLAAYLRTAVRAIGED